MDQVAKRDITTIRSFNRTYTLRLGLLAAHLAESSFTLSEGRILFELAHRDDPTAAEIAKVLRLDRAQISRTLKRFAERGLVTMREDPAHGRHQLLTLTPEGRTAFDRLDEGARNGIAELLKDMPPSRRRRLVDAAASIEGIFRADAPPTLMLRGLRPGDLGLVIHRQAILYAAEYGYDGSYEALISRILADFHTSFDPLTEAAWIAELDGEVAGSIFLVRGSDETTGKLRLLYVEPDARGGGVGRRLIDTCIERARDVGYQRLELWTDGQLVSARRLYERAGFVLQDSRKERHFAQTIKSETWTLEL